MGGGSVEDVRTSTETAATNKEGSMREKKTPLRVTKMGLPFKECFYFQLLHSLKRKNIFFLSV